MNPILRMRALWVEAPNGQVLVDNVDVTLEQGEVLGLIGESGAGKSTIGLAALGYARGRCRITGGEVWLTGENILGATPQRQRALRATEVAYVAQSAAAAFNPALTIGEPVCEGPLRHKLMSRDEVRAWSRELFASLDLPDPDSFGRHYPHQVSSGQLQRAMVAMAMSHASRRQSLCSMNRLQCLTSPRRSKCWSCCAGSCGSSARQRSTSRTTWRWSRRSQTGSWCCGTAG